MELKQDHVTINNNWHAAVCRGERVNERTREASKEKRANEKESEQANK